MVRHTPKPPAALLSCDGSWHGGHWPGEAGLTLMEMMTVLAIVAAMFAISAGVYRKVSVSYALPAATSRVSSIVRAARNYTLTSSLPSRVFVDREKNQVTAFGYELVGAWHLEEVPLPPAGADLQPLPERFRVLGGGGEVAELFGRCYAARGKIGSGLEFGDDGAAVVAEALPRYEAPFGFGLEAWVNFWPPPLTESERQRALEARSGRRGAWVDPRREERYAVISLSGSYQFGLLGDGAVYLEIGPAGDPDTYLAVTRSAEVPSNRWVHLSCTFDGLSLTISVDGSERYWFPDGFELIDESDHPRLPLRVPPSDGGGLSISSPIAMFVGLIDEPKVRVALEPHSYQPPAGVHIVSETTTLHFDSRGSLDPLFHSAPVIIELADVPPAPVADAPVGRTAVSGLSPLEEEARTAAESKESAESDPLAALAEYLEEKSEGEIETGSGAAESVRASESGTAIGRSRGRVQRVIVDLTGAIRG